MTSFMLHIQSECEQARLALIFLIKVVTMVQEIALLNTQGGFLSVDAQTRS
jgi:hypothetical protein